MDVAELAQRFVDAVNRHDPDAILEMMHPEVSFKSSRDVEPMIGLDGVTMYIEAVFESELQYEVKNRFVDGSSVITELNIFERRPDGLATVRNALVRQTFEDGLIVEQRNYADAPRIRDDVFE